VSDWERGDQPRQNTIENAKLVEYTSCRGETYSFMFFEDGLFVSLLKAMYEIIAAGTR
jgi:hypothetical protein